MLDAAVLLRPMCNGEPESVMPYCYDIDFKPLTAAERRAMEKILDEIEEIIARAGQRT